MHKKVVLVFICFLFLSIKVLAVELPVKISPCKLIKTANNQLNEGDYIEFYVVEDVNYKGKVIINKNDKIYGVLTSREENNFLAQEAHIYIDNFHNKSKPEYKIKFSGNIYKSGTRHDIIPTFLTPITEILMFFIRGGEVKIRPNKDQFIIYAEVF